MKIVLPVFLASLLSMLPAKGADQNTYSNPTLGISVTKPSDWVFATAQQHAENLKNVKLNDEEFQKLMEKYSTAPLVALMKHQEPFGDLNPSLNIKARPLGSVPSSEPVAILNRILPTLQKTFSDLEVIDAAKETIVGGQKAGYMKIHYNLQVPDAGSFPTCSEMWVVPRGKILFIIGAGTRQDEKTGSRDEIRKILASMKID